MGELDLVCCLFVMIEVMRLHYVLSINCELLGWIDFYARCSCRGSVGYEEYPYPITLACV